MFYAQVSAHFSFSDDVSQCCRLSFWRCLFVLRANFVHVSVGDTGGVVARVSCLEGASCPWEWALRDLLSRSTIWL